MILIVKKKFIITIIFLITIIQTSNIPNLEKDNIFTFQKTKTRRLFNRVKFEEICTRANSEVIDFFETGTTSLNYLDYVDDSKYFLHLIDAYETKKYNRAEPFFSYFHRLIPMLIFFLINLYFVIVWPISLCCLFNCKCCCCFCCCPHSINKKWKTVFFFISGGAFVISFVLFIYLLSAINKYFKEIDTISCTMYRVLSETVEGESKTILPKWQGIREIKSILFDLFNEVVDTSNTFTNDYDDVKSMLELSQNEFNTSLYNDIYGLDDNGIGVTGPDSSNSFSNVIPEYALYYGPKESTGTMLYKINNEYTSLTSPIIELIDETYNRISFIYGEFLRELEYADYKIDDLQINLIDFEEFWESFDELLYEMKNNKKKIIIQFIIVMVLCLGMIALYIINFINICSNSKKALSIITTIFWNLLYLLSFLLLFQGSLLGMFAIFIKDCSTLSNYVVSSENLDRGEPRFFKNEISIDYFNTCINGNGNIKELFFTEDFMEHLNQLNSISDTLNSQITSLSNHKESEIIKEDFTLKNYDLKFLDCNYYKGNTDPIEIYDFTSWFEKLNKYTSSVSGNYQTGPIYYDEYWGITNSKSGYVYYNTVSNIQANANSKYLLNIYDGWTKDNVEKRYESLGSASGTYSSVADAAKDIIDKFRNVEKDMKDYYLNPIKQNIDLINEKFKDVTNNIVITLETLISQIDTVNNFIINKLEKEDSIINTVLDCSFLGPHFKYLLKQVHKSVDDVVYPYACVFVSTFLILFFALFSSLFYMVLVKKIHNVDNNEDKDKDKDKNNVEELEEENENENENDFTN